MTKKRCFAHDAKELPGGGVQFEVAGWCPPSLNGSGGLMRMHWSGRNVAKSNMQLLVRNAKLPQFPGQVRLEYTRISPRKMDWDNVASTMKVLCDALVHEGVIVDDSPKWVPDAPKLEQETGPLGFRLNIFPIEKDS